MAFPRRISRPSADTFLKVNINFPLEMAKQIQDYHQSLLDQGIAGYGSDTIRELVQLGLSSNPRATIIAADRRRAYNEARVYLLTQVRQTFTTIIAEMKEAADTGARLVIKSDKSDSENEGE